MSTAEHYYHHNELANDFEVAREAKEHVSEASCRYFQAETDEKLALEDPRLRPTVPYALTISNMTLKMLNHGSSMLFMTRSR